MLKKGKAAGYDQITGEMLKNLGRNGLILLTDVFNKAMNENTIPKDWEVGVIIPIFKKGDKTQCTNYRGITLLSVACKLYERILEQRIRRIIEPQLDQSQSGFRKGRSIQDHIFTIKQLTERAKITSKNIYAAFIDIEKAFDRVPRSAINESMVKRNISTKLRQAIMSLYRTTRNYVRTDNMESREFVVKEGLRQGGVLSPLLFNLVMDDIIKETGNKTSKLYVGHRCLKPVWIKQCAFADDLAIFAETEQELQKNVGIWNRALMDRKLKINVEKTRVMVMGKTSHDISVQIDGKAIKQEETFKYLGVLLSSNGNQEVEIKARIESAARLYHSIKNTLIGKREISRKVKMSVYRAVFTPILIFGSESWTVTKKIKSQIQSMEMKFLRRVMGITKMDRIRNVEVRKELDIEPIVNKIERNQLRWYGHLIRMDRETPVKSVWESRVQHKRPRGRPTVTWNENIEKILQQKGVGWAEARMLAKDKKKWRNVVYEGHVHE